MANNVRRKHGVKECINLEDAQIETSKSSGAVPIDVPDKRRKTTAATKTLNQDSSANNVGSKYNIKECINSEDAQIESSHSLETGPIDVPDKRRTIAAATKTLNQDSSGSTMCTATGLEHLPVDALEHITNLLSPADLSRCCAVSRSWYKIFDSDIFWRKHFNKNIANYLKGAKCQVEPPLSEGAPSLPVSCYRGNYLREARLWKNWRNGKYKLEEIELDYECIIEFLNNDHVLLHRLLQTEVWDVSQEPTLVLKIPFNINESWEENLVKFVKNKLIVVWCNVVKVFSICLESKTSCLNHVFFFDQTEEFSTLNLSDEKIIDEVFQKTSFNIANDFNHIICGSFIVGIVITDKKKMPIHVWNATTGKKLKEDVCPVFPSDPIDISFKADKISQDRVLVRFHFLEPKHISAAVLYDLEKLHFVADSTVLCNGDLTLFDKYLFAFTYDTLIVYDYENDRNALKNKGPIILSTIKCKNYAFEVQIFENKVLVPNDREILCIDPAQASLNEVKSFVKVDFPICDFYVIQDRFLVFSYGVNGSLQEIWEVGENTKQVLISLPMGSDVYKAVNSACTRIVLERGNKLIVLNFW